MDVEISAWLLLLRYRRTGVGLSASALNLLWPFLYVDLSNLNHFKEYPSSKIPRCGLVLCRKWNDKQKFYQSYIDSDEKGIKIVNFLWKYLSLVDIFVKIWHTTDKYKINSRKIKKSHENMPLWFLYAAGVIDRFRQQLQFSAGLHRMGTLPFVNDGKF